MLQLKQENLNHPSFEPRFIIWVKLTEDRAFLWGLPHCGKNSDYLSTNVFWVL